MLPLLQPGCRVVIAPRRIYLPGDIVAFRSDKGNLLVHRVLGYRPYIFGLYIQTAGDAAPSLDRPIRRADILGRVVEGDCHSEIFRIPLSTRIAAISRLAGRVVQKAIKG
jgi:hypothetical protein